MQVGDRAALHTQKRDSGLDASAVSEAWETTRKSASSDWLLVGFDGASKDKIVVKAQGSGGFSGARAALSDDDVLFGAIPFVHNGQKKFFFLTAVGKNVSGMKKARVSMSKQGVYNSFSGVVADVTAMEPSELDGARAKIAKDLGLGGHGEKEIELE